MWGHVLVECVCVVFLMYRYLHSSLHWTAFTKLLCLCFRSVLLRVNNHLSQCWIGKRRPPEIPGGSTHVWNADVLLLTLLGGTLPKSSLG